MDQNVVTVSTLLAEALNQLSFICALIGGFSIALIAGLITLEKTRLNKFIMIVMSFVTVSQIGTTLFLALSSFRIYTYKANKNLDKLTMLLKNFDQTHTPFILVFFFFSNSLFWRYFFKHLKLWEEGWNCCEYFKCTNVFFSTIWFVYLTLLESLFSFNKSN